MLLWQQYTVFQNLPQYFDQKDEISFYAILPQPDASLKTSAAGSFYCAK
jgi:hypothetical protein